MKNKDYRRPVSDNDYLYEQIQDLFSTFAINLVVEGEGAIDLAELQDAVRRASEICPGARLVKSGDVWVDSGRAPPVHLVEGVEFDSNGLGSIPEIEAKIDPETGPTAEVVVLRIDPAIVVFRVFHGVMDGKGVLTWMENIFSAMNGESSTAVASTETDLMYLNRRPHRSQRHKTQFDVQTLAQPSPTRDFRVWRRRLTLPGKPNRVVARVAEVICSLGISETNRFLIPVDIRRHEKGHLSTANLTLPIFLEAFKGENWRQIHERLLKGLRNNDELNIKSADLGPVRRLPVFLLKLGMRMAVGIQNRINRQICGAIISNLGVIDLDAISTSQFRATTLYSLTVQQPMAPFAVVIASNRHTTEVVISCYANDALIARAEKILATLAERLSGTDAYQQLNRTEREYPADVTVIDLIESRISQSPNAIAIEVGGHSMSYGDLGREVDRLATHFSSIGVSSDDIVAIYMHRDRWLMPAILAVLKLGAIYVPIDPESTAERNSRILESSKSCVCITTSDLQNRLSSAMLDHVVLIDELNFRKQEIPLIGNQSNPNGVMYLMYTSGSTGLPKGVQIEHRSLVNYLFWARGAYDVDEQSVFPLFASIAFDSTLTSMFLPLIAGGRIEVHQNPVDHLVLQGIFASESVTHIKLSPSLLQLAVRSKSAEGKPKSLILGGEQLNRGLAQQAQETFGTQWKIINEYGPTEATIGTVVHTFDAREDADEPMVPIGRPIANTRVHLLDEDLNPTPPGQTGEIYLSGNSLARGYAFNAEETDRRFVMLDHNIRAYRTGDSARLNTRGELVYTGRLDDQVSIRGHRVELAEIESALCSFKGVGDAAILANNSTEGRPSLIAFYTAERPVGETDLRQHMKASLPSHMQISQFVYLCQMPLTNNGKVDKAALSIPEENRPQQSITSSMETGNPDELVLAKIWRRALEMGEEEFIDFEDDLYDLGGDSLTILIVLEDSTRQLLGGASEAELAEIMTKITDAPTFKNMASIIAAVRQSRLQNTARSERVQR